MTDAHEQILAEVSAKIEELEAQLKELRIVANWHRRHLGVERSVPMPGSRRNPPGSVVAAAQTVLTQALHPMHASEIRDAINVATALCDIEFWATEDRFARLLDVLRLRDWHRCGDRWHRPDGTEADADEAMEWAVRTEPTALKVTMEVTVS